MYKGLGNSIRQHWWLLKHTESIVYGRTVLIEIYPDWFGNPCSEFRYCLSWIWLAETNRRIGPLVLFDLVLALEVGLFPFGLGFFDYNMLKGQRLTSTYTLFIAASQQSIYTLTSCDPF